MKVIYAGRSGDLPREIGRCLFEDGFRMAQAFDVDSALTLIAANGAKVLLLDLEIPGGCALSLLEKARRSHPALPVLALVDGEQLEKQARAMALGAREIVALPAEPEALAERAKSLAGLAFVSIETHGHESIWSETSGDIYRRIESAARSKATVLITGETGTGKEVAARTLHELSARKAKPYIAVNCAALSSGLLESELFGHEKGAFTDASFARKGRFEEAEGGTILLDEISEMDLRLQAKLLRVLQEGTFERVGSNRVQRPDVRVVATSNRDLKAEVEQGRFRKDLYYRLNVLAIHMPALRERTGDISLFLDFFSRMRGVSIAREARIQLLRYAWPGNVREVENLFEQFSVMGDGRELTTERLPSEVRDAAPDPERVDAEADQTLAMVLASTERRILERALQTSGGNQAKAARMLGIARSTLRSKLLNLGLVSPLEAVGEED